MKTCLLFYIICWSVHLHAHDRLNFLKEGQTQEVCILKQDTETICGTTNLSMLFDAGKLVLTNSKNEQINVFNANIKYIFLDSIRFQTLIMKDGAYFNEYYIREIDSIGKVKLYEGYTIVTKEYGNSSYIGGTTNSSTDINFSYLLKMGNKQVYVISEYNQSARNDSKTKYIKQLKKIFSKYPEVVQYIESIENLEFDAIPAVIRHINSLI